MAEDSLKSPSPFWMLALLAAVSMPAAQEEREKPLPNKPGKPIREAATWPKLSAKDTGRTKGLLKLLRSKNEDAASRASRMPEGESWRCHRGSGACLRWALPNASFT